MSADLERLALIRPGMPADELKSALGEHWNEPGKHDEGRVFHGGFSARIGSDGLIGEVRFRAPFPLGTPVHGIFMDMEFQRFHALYPEHLPVPDGRENFGWTFFSVRLPEGLDLIAGVKEDTVRIITIRNPEASYPERPYKFADSTLTQAYDLMLADPVSLDNRPADGWCFGRPPGIDGSRWPISPIHGTPLRHAYTLKLPTPYRARGLEYAAISLFVDDQFEDLPRAAGLKEWCERLAHDDAAVADPVFGRFAAQFKHGDALRFDMEHWDCRYVLIWLTEAEFAGPLGLPPDPAALPGRIIPAWLSKSPAEYFGEEKLPATTAEQRQQDNFSPGGYGVDQLLAATRPKTGWKNLPALEALDFGWPIQVALREGDPNTGKPPREWEDQNALSGYIPVYSDVGVSLDLLRFLGRHAHLGGTMFPAQGYPDFSPFYIEFTEVFGGFNFGGGVAQLDLKEMEISWAC